MWFVFKSLMNGMLMGASIFGFLIMVLVLVFNDDPNSWEARQERAEVAHKEARKTYKMALKSTGDVEKRTPEGMTPLMVAAEANDLGPVLELVAKGALVNARSSEGWTPLMFAARRGNVDMVRFLLAHGAKVNVRDMDGRTPLLCAITPRNRMRLESWENCEKRFPVSHGALNIDSEVIRLLLEHGAAVDAKDEVDGLTALQYCFLNEYRSFSYSTEKLVQLLLDHGASADVRTKSGNTLLHMAVEQDPYGSHAEIFKLLLGHGVPVDAKNDKGETALFLHLKKERSSPSASVIRQFLEHGTAVNVIGEGGKNLLHYVSELRGDDVLACVRFLLKRGIPVDIRDHKGNTPLMRAAWQGELATVQLLLENGAFLNARSYGGWSVLMDAALGGNAHKVKFLLEKGATITLEDLKSLQLSRENMIKAGFYWELQEAAYR